jgi:hypothetical protein
MDGLVKLKNNIQGYLKRLYLGQFISGALISLGLIGLMWVFFSLLEYMFRFSTQARMVLFFGFMIIASGLLIIQIVIPLLRFFQILKQKDTAEVARDLGQKISSVEDRIVNVLNLEDAFRESHNILAGAGLQQKANELNTLNFSDTIDLRSSFRWIRLTMVPLLITVILMMWDARILSDSSVRLVRYSESFVAPAPFSFDLINEKLEVPEGANFHLQVKTEGTSMPENAFVIVDGAEFKMKSEGAAVFSFDFSNVRSDKRFQLRGASVYSSEMVLTAIPKPKVLRNEAYFDFPAYTQKPNETILNRTQISIPEGTKVKWKFDIKNSLNRLVLIDSMRSEQISDKKPMVIEREFRNSALLTIALEGEKGLKDSAQVKINVVRDVHPSIVVNDRVDSTNGTYYFQGRIGDDYGLTRLKFHVVANGESTFSEVLAVNPQMLDQGFAYAWNPDSLLQAPGEELEYYFEVWDNDGVNGSKSTKSKVWSIKMPSIDEISEESSERASKTKASLSNSSSELEKMQKELNNLKKELLEKKKPDWQDREALKTMLEKQKEMMENLEKKSIEQSKQQHLDEKFNAYSEEIMQKQEMIQDMFEKLFDEEFKQKYEELNKLMDEMTKSQMLEKLDEMNLDNEQLEKELDRTLELFKQLELEKKVEENIARLDELIGEQDALKKETENKKSDAESLSEKQDELGEKAEKLTEELEEMKDLNEALEEPQSLPELDELADGAKEDMEKAEDELSKGNKGKASGSQGEAKDKMEQMKEQLASFQQEQSKNQQTENLEDMRQLLENIIDLSLSQERVMEALKPVNGNDPRFVELTKNQKNLVDDTRIVEDSLLALSKRVPQISKVINDEMSAVKYNMSKSVSYMSDQPPNREDQYKAMSLERQQYAMTSLNNLALVFDEIIQNMQKQMAPMSKGNGQCDKPGSGKGAKPSVAEMKKMQESLNKQLEELKKALEKGETPNGKKPGQKPGNENGTGGQGGLGGGLSKEIAQMAAQQAALRKQIREMSESLNNDGSGAGGNLKEIEKMMEQTEEDILFQKINAETMRRQQEILSKLLESERADREREFEERRESKSSTMKYVIPEDIWNKFELEKEKELELYKTVPHLLKPFYRNEVNRYFINLQE